MRSSSGLTPQRGLTVVAFHFFWPVTRISLVSLVAHVLARGLAALVVTTRIRTSQAPRRTISCSPRRSRDTSLYHPFSVAAVSAVAVAAVAQGVVSSAGPIPVHLQPEEARGLKIVAAEVLRQLLLDDQPLVHRHPHLHLLLPAETYGRQLARAPVVLLPLLQRR